MSLEQITLLLLLSSIVGAAMLVVLLVARQTLGSSAHGTWAWVVGDLLKAAGRLMVICGFMPGFVAVWQARVGPWHHHVWSAGFHLAAFWAQVWALRAMAGRPVPPPNRAVATGGAIWIGWVLLAGALSPDTVLPLVMVAISLALVAVVVTLLPLLRTFWGARLMLLPLLSGVIHSVFMLGQMLSDGGRAAPADTTVLGPVFIGELVAGLISTMGYLLMQQERLRQHIVELSVTDALTGAYNRHGLLPVLRRELSASSRATRPVSVVLFDLDHFKRINDQFGHAVGDAVLRGVVSRVRAQTRPRDALGRWGGEEFLLVLPDLAAAQAGQVAERICQALRERPIDCCSERQVPVTISAGVAQHDASREVDEQLLDHLVDRADRALYLAKRQRDCVVVDEATDVACRVSPGRAA